MALMLSAPKPLARRRHGGVLWRWDAIAGALAYQVRTAPTEEEIGSARAEIITATEYEVPSGHFISVRATAGTPTSPIVGDWSSPHVARAEESPQFLYLCPDANGRPTVGVMLTQGEEAHLQMALMFPTPKERRALPKATLTVEDGPQVNMSHDALAEMASALFFEALKMEARKPEMVGFVSLAPDTTNRYLLRFYLPDPRDWQGDANMTGMPGDLERTAKERGIRMVARKITEHDVQVLDGIHERILAHCSMNHRLRTLFVKLRGPGDGIEAGVRWNLDGNER